MLTIKNIAMEDKKFFYNFLIFILTHPCEILQFLFCYFDVLFFAFRN